MRMYRTIPLVVLVGVYFLLVDFPDRKMDDFIYCRQLKDA